MPFQVQSIFSQLFVLKFDPFKLNAYFLEVISQFLELSFHGLHFFGVLMLKLFLFLNFFNSELFPSMLNVIKFLEKLLFCFFDLILFVLKFILKFLVFDGQ